MANKDLVPELIPIKPDQPNSQEDANAPEGPKKAEEPPLKKEEKEKENKEIEKKIEIEQPKKEEKENIEQNKEIKEQQNSPNIDETRKKKLILLSQKFSKTNNGKKYKGYRRGSASPSISAQFLDQFSLIAIQEENENDEGDRGNNTPMSDSTNKKSSYENSREIENTKKLFGIEDKKSDKNNPFKNDLLNKINKLKQSQEEINYHFEKDRRIYLRKIEILENTLKGSFDNKKLKDLERINQDNKEEIKKKEKELEDTEKEKIRDKKNFHDKLNEIVELKNTLIKELKELAIMAKKLSFQDYDKYPKKEYCTKIEKLNFRQDDSRYLFTNEYETSREEESFSSYDKLNKINSTPGGAELYKYKNKKNDNNIYNNNYKNNYNNNNLGRTEQYFLDMKSLDNKESNKNTNRSKNNNSIFTMGKYNPSDKRNSNNSNFISEYLNQQKINKRNSNEKSEKAYDNNNYNNYRNSYDIISNNTNKYDKFINNKEASNTAVNNINNNAIINNNEDIIDTSSNNNYLRSLERIKNNMPMPENNIKTKKPSDIIMRKFPKEPKFLPSDVVLIREFNKTNSDVFY